MVAFRHISILITAFAVTAPASVFVEEATPESIRRFHTATAISATKILLIGGASSSGPPSAITSAEIYEAGTFSSVGSMFDERLSHTATLLPDGRVLVAGGRNERTLALASVEIFDPSIRTFARFAPMLEPRTEHSATLLPNGHVLFAGGLTTDGTVLFSAEEYDPVTQSSIRVGDMKVRRLGHFALLLANGRILVVGGRSGGNANDGQAQIYDLAQRTFEFAGFGVSVNAPAVVLFDNTVLIQGDVIATIYDPFTKTVATQPLECSQTGAVAALLQNGDVLFAGGSPRCDPQSAATLRYNFRSGEFQRDVAMRYSRLFQTATPMHDGSVVVVGGGSDPIPSEQYEPLYRRRAVRP